MEVFAHKLKSVFLKSDIIAGATVALVLIPQSLAYAQLAGLPPQFGLYAALIPPVVASFFGSSKQLATGPVAVLSLMTAASVSTIYSPGSNEYITTAILLGLMLGLFQLFLGIARLGSLVSFLSHPVIYGFTNAAAIIIATTQLAKFFGVSVGQYEHHYQTVLAVLQKAVGNTDWVTLIFGVWALVAMYTIRSINKKFPAVLFTVFLASVFSFVIHYEGALIGTIPLGLPSFALPVFNSDVFMTLLPTAITMGLIGFTEAISIAQAIAVKTRDRINPNKELIGQGLGNIIGSLFQSYPTPGSFSRTAVNFQAGAKTSASSYFASILVLLTLIFFTKFLYYIPQVVLAAVIVVSVGTLIDFKKIKHIWYINRYDAIAAGLTFITTLYFAPHLDKGIIIGVLFSIAHYLYRNVHPRIVFLSKYKDGWLHDVEKFGLGRCTNIAVIRLDAPLFFANASFFENEVINDIVKNPDIHDVLIIAHGINQIDATGEEMLESLYKSLRTADKGMFLSEMKSPIMDLFVKAGLRDEIGKKHFFVKTEDAIQAIMEHLEKKDKHTDTLHCPLKKYITYHHQVKALETDKRETIAYFYHKLSL
jgi:SulP family sulfate permease